MVASRERVCRTTKRLFLPDPAWSALDDAYARREDAERGLSRGMLPPARVLVAWYGAFGLPLIHVGAYLGDNRVLEFSPTRGAIVSSLLGADRREGEPASFYARAARDLARVGTCVPSLSDHSHVRVYALRPSVGAPAGGADARTRVDLVLSRLHARDYRMATFNCEHVATYVLAGQASSAQAERLLRCGRGPKRARALVAAAVDRGMLSVSLRDGLASLALSVLLLRAAVRRRGA